MTEPQRYSNRIVEITVGQALDGVGCSAWAIERYDCCNCPTCNDGIHWMDTGTGVFNTRIEAKQYWLARGSVMTTRRAAIAGIRSE